MIETEVHPWELGERREIYCFCWCWRGNVREEGARGVKPEWEGGRKEGEADEMIVFTFTKID